MLCKICGITRQDDLAFAARAGFDFCGFIFHAKSPRCLEPKQAARLDSGPMRRVGVFVEQSAAQILEIMQAARLDYAQLHGGQSCAEAKMIGSERVIRVLWPDKYSDPEALMAEAAAHASVCSWFLLDAGDQGGGSGQTLHWQKLAALRLPRPFFLAGGLTEQNCQAAMAACDPCGLDFNSGLEQKPGVKDHQKMATAIATVRGL